MTASAHDIEKEIAVRAARDDFLQFVRYTMPNPNNPDGVPDPGSPDDPEVSRYEITPQARLLADVLEKVEKGELLRVCVSIGPQLGKSQLISRHFPAWSSGRNPYKHMMLGSYNQEMANSFGEDVRQIMAHERFADVFPEYKLRKAAASQLITEDDGKLAFVGVGGSGSGKPADTFIIDDPIKGMADVQSDAFRKGLKDWFNGVANARLHTFSSMIIVHTRWHEDDLIGWLVDPDHPDHDPEIAKDWVYVNLPAVVTDPKMADALGLDLQPPPTPTVATQFGDKPMASIWEKRKSLEFLASARRLDARSFDSLYMGKPMPDDGEYFLSDWLVEYDAEELPPRDQLEVYAASDHATSTKQGRDSTILGCGGVDKNDILWILPDLVWDKMETDRTVEEMIEMMKRNQPSLWWMEDELISKSFGPFLRKQMVKQKVFCALDPIRPSGDKRVRARAIQGRMGLKQVRFPRFAYWWKDARSQLLKFDAGTHDDFVDFMSYFGLGLLKEFSPAADDTSDKAPKYERRIDYIMADIKRKALEGAKQKANAGW